MLISNKGFTNGGFQKQDVIYGASMVSETTLKREKVPFSSKQYKRRALTIRSINLQKQLVRAMGRILTSDETLHAENLSPVTTECPQHLGEKKSTPCFSFSENETSFNIQDSSGDEGLPPLIVEVEETIPEMPFPSNRVYL
ncbi:hypothetical protein JTE90_025267 [Oedothorax gibbosus]|uniref:Uncharacterized protein n=1 Tax=Oedothorax gibbosus TaxID=931172 RepID=A0AAV6U7X0_9ARAC|nr:hypothetical protein JTE90_025267 [Oedothorax gibbosus]